MSPPIVFLFGATGNIGRVLVNELLPDQSAGRLKLIAAVRRPEAAAELEERGVETRLVNLDDAEMEGVAPLVETMRGADRVFLLTTYEIKMLAQSKAVIDAANTVGATHMVHVGAVAHQDTTDAHLGWHQLVEAYIERSGIGFTHVHPSQFMQTLPMLYAMGGSQPGVIENFIGDTRIGWVDAADIAAVAAAALRDPAAHAGKAYRLATELASMTEVVAMLTEVTGAPWRYVPQEPEVFYQKATAGGADAVYMKAVRNAFVRTRGGTLPELSELHDNARSVTGRDPTKLRTFIERNRAVFEGAPAQ
jgi:NAD(P)H dehydrogenase (quinone)